MSRPSVKTCTATRGDGRVAARARAGRRGGVRASGRRRRRRGRAGAASRPAALRVLHRRDERGILEERPVADREIDAQQVLRNHAPGAEVQVADLGISHQSRGKPDGFARRLEQRPGLLREPAVEDRRPRERDRVARRRRREAPAVADQEDDRRSPSSRRRSRGDGPGARVARQASARGRRARGGRPCRPRTESRRRDPGATDARGRERHRVEEVHGRAAGGSPRRAPGRPTRGSRRSSAGRVRARVFLQLVREARRPRIRREGRRGAAREGRRRRHESGFPRGGAVDPGREGLEDAALRRMRQTERLERQSEAEDLAVRAGDRRVERLRGLGRRRAARREPESHLVREDVVAQEDAESLEIRDPEDTAPVGRPKGSPMRRPISMPERPVRRAARASAVGIGRLLAAEDRRRDAELPPDAVPMLPDLRPRAPRPRRATAGSGETSAQSGSTRPVSTEAPERSDARRALRRRARRGAARRGRARKKTGDGARAAPRASSPRARSRARRARRNRSPHRPRVEVVVTPADVEIVVGAQAAGPVAEARGRRESCGRRNSTSGWSERRGGAGRDSGPAERPFARIDRFGAARSRRRRGIARRRRARRAAAPRGVRARRATPRRGGKRRTERILLASSSTSPKSTRRTLRTTSETPTPRETMTGVPCCSASSAVRPNGSEADGIT